MSRSIPRTLAMTVAVVTAASGLAACGSKSSDSGSAGGGITAACSLTNPPTSAATTPAPSTSTKQVSGKVGVILPDTQSSTRYTLYDAPLLTAALKKAGITPDVQNAQGSDTKFAQIAQSMIGEGVKVLIIDSIDQASGAGVEREATQAGVKVIDYDRVNLGGTAQYYVSFDNEDVGRLQAKALVACLDQDNVSDPKIIMEDGGTNTDNNAVLFAKGAHEVLDPLQKAGKLKIVSEVVDQSWNPATAGQTFNGALQAAGGNIDGVLAANDDIANAVIGELKNSGLDGHVIVTGQDSGIEGLQNILKGLQSMTIFKQVQLEAGAASQLAIALMSGESPSSAGLNLQPFTDPQSASHKIEALLLPAEVITQNNVDDVVKAGALKASDVCKGVESDCSKFDVS